LRASFSACYQARKDDYESDRLPLQDFVEPAQRLLPWMSSEGQLTYGVPSLRGTVIPPPSRR
jgi:hypothetical protein